MAQAAGGADIFAVVADPTRRRLLQLLAHGERTAMELVAAFDISQPAISQHLRTLRDAGLVKVRQLGRKRLYRLEAAQLKEIAEFVAAFDKFWDKRLDGLGKYLDKKHGKQTGGD